VSIAVDSGLLSGMRTSAETGRLQRLSISAAIRGGGCSSLHHDNATMGNIVASLQQHHGRFDADIVGHKRPLPANGRRRCGRSAQPPRRTHRIRRRTAPFSFQVNAAARAVKLRQDSGCGRRSTTRELCCWRAHVSLGVGKGLQRAGAPDGKSMLTGLWTRRHGGALQTQTHARHEVGTGGRVTTLFGAMSPRLKRPASTTARSWSPDISRE